MKGSARVGAAQGAALIDTMTIDASGEAVDTRIFGGDLPRLAYTARLDGGALAATAKGTFAGFDPAVLTGRSNLEGAVAGRLDVAVQIDDVRGPIAPETLVASGRVELADSTVGGMAIDTGAIEGQVDRGEGNIKTLEVRGTDLHVTASGPVDLRNPDAGGAASSATNLTYHIDTSNLEKLGRLLGQPLAGAVNVDGRLTGNRAELKTEGAIDGSNVKYGEHGALDLNAKYALSVPNLSFADATVGAETTATFVTVGGLELREVAAKTTYTGEHARIRLHDQRSWTRAGGDRHAHRPRGSQRAASAGAGASVSRHRVAARADGRDRAVRSTRDSLEGHPVGEWRAVAGRGRHDRAVRSRGPAEAGHYRPT